MVMTYAIASVEVGLMDEVGRGIVSPQIVLQIVSLEARRRVWVARARKNGGYQAMKAPTEGLAHFHGLRVHGLLCAETLDGRERIRKFHCSAQEVDWREVSIGRARQLARLIAAKTGGVVHLALFDEPDRVVWEPVASG